MIFIIMIYCIHRMVFLYSNKQCLRCSILYTCLVLSVHTVLG